MRRRFMLPGVTLPAIALAVLGALLTGAPAAQAAAVEQLRLTFDAPPGGQAEPGPWSTGCFADAAGAADNACIQVAAPGEIARVTRPTGGTTSPAVKFPAAGAGKAVLEVPHAAHLNPGTADFTITALVKISSAELSSANIVQKGLFATPEGQWKLQVENGRPSCRIGGLRDGVLVSAMATWPTSVADTGWKFLSCKRRGATLSISVDNATPVNAPESAAMHVANTVKVSIGARGTGTSNDQFHGALDNVVFSVG
ncbi:MAG TPA: LamG-like jellyroll fold domain-containing protein [Pilimelia sp.]|nr:LamG-like jellyroll fold domain-containing protein [Pilimelia sp.]